MKKAAIILFAYLFSVLVLSSMITATIIAILDEPDSYSFKSPYEVNFAYAIGIGLIVIVLQTILALSSYLNLIKTVRNNRLYSALSFFLLPLLFLLYFLFFTGTDDIIPLLLIVELPFFTLLSASFILFRKQIQK